MTEDAYLAQPIVSGMWKFSDSIPIERLVAVARGWSMGADGDQYTDIHVRKCSKDQHGIGFKYKLNLAGAGVPGYWERAHKNFFHKMTDQLKRMFGNDFVGWDVSSSTWVIK